MATAYAALVSLMNVLTRYQHPTCPVSFNQSQIHSMLNKVGSLMDFLDAHSQRMSNDLLAKMSDAAFAAEDMVESYYVDQILSKSAGTSDTGYDCLCQDLEKAIEGMDLIVQQVMKVKGQAASEEDQKPESSTRVGPGLPSSGMSKMVGFDDELLRLLDQVASNKSSLQILPIVGMGGIGKTTLARNLFEHAYVRNHFHIQSWATISQDCSFEKVIRSLLSDLHVVGSGGEKLYKHLCGRKYLIILDDMWDNFVWSEIRRFFPDNCNGSRILITTRISNVAASVGSCNPHEVKLLGGNKSWDLFSRTVFGKEVCPLELKKCGEKITKSCKGLPLAIVVVGGLLKMSQKTLHNWESVAENANSFISRENDGHCMEILSLSYNNLPTHLKPCFLYMSTFEEDNEISVFSLTSLWAADGLLRPIKDRTLEEIALEYLNDLVNRNLIMVGSRGSAGRLVTCSFHDLLREFCSREAQKEGFLCHLKKDMPFGSERRFVCDQHRGVFQEPFPSMPIARSLICGFDQVDFSSCRLLRVLIASRLNMNVRGLVNLRYLACQVDANSDISRVFDSLSLFWNLESLLLFGRYETLTLPSEFWELSNLRHLMSGLITYLPDPTNASANCVLDSLETLSNIRNFNCSDEVLNKIPNLKMLMTSYVLGSSEYLEEHSYHFSNLARLPKLEELSCSFNRNGANPICIFREPKNLTFSPSLRELTLNGSCIPWENMTTVGSLPKLEVLVLEDDAFHGEEWCSTEGDFQCLKRLSIYNCFLRIWSAESYHFPRLMQLSLSHVDLEAIPLDIGEIISLRTIRLNTSKMPVIVSAKEILDERQNQGNDDLLISCQCNGKPEEFPGWENFASSNFHFHFSSDVGKSGDEEDTDEDEED